MDNYTTDEQLIRLSEMLEDAYKTGKYSADDWAKVCASVAQDLIKHDNDRLNFLRWCGLTKNLGHHQWEHDYTGYSERFSN